MRQTELNRLSGVWDLRLYKSFFDNANDAGLSRDLIKAAIGIGIGFEVTRLVARRMGFNFGSQEFATNVRLGSLTAVIAGTLLKRHYDSWGTRLAEEIKRRGDKGNKFWKEQIEDLKNK